jgi:plasmid replication initiation protein
MPERHQHRISARTAPDPFEAIAGDVLPRAQCAFIDRSFFSHSVTKQAAPILFKTRNAEVQVRAVTEHGVARISVANALVWAASEILAADDRAFSTSLSFRFARYQLLAVIGRVTGNREHLPLKGALTRLQSTVVRIAIRPGERWRRQQFSWIHELQELDACSSRCQGMHFVLPQWFDQGVLDLQLVLAIDPADLAQACRIKCWLYRVARKHTCRQPQGWRFDRRHLHAKCARSARFSDFALEVRRFVRCLSHIGKAIEQQGGSDLVVMRPARSTQIVDDLWTTRPGIGTSGVNDVGISSAAASEPGALGSQPNQWRAAAPASIRGSESQTKSYLVEAFFARRKSSPRAVDEEGPS